MGSFSSVPVIGDIAGAIVDTGMSLIGLDAQKDAAKDLQNWQNDYNTAMWVANNAYNHPTAQMQRLREAGINPNLAYASGVSGMTASSPSSGSSSAGSMPKVTNLANSLGNSLSLGKTLPLTIKNLEEDIETKKVNQDVGNSQVAANYANESYLLARITDVFADAANKHLDYDIRKAAKDNIIKNYQYQNDLMEAQKHSLYKKALLDEANTTLSILEQVLSEQKLINLQAEFKKINAETSVLNEKAIYEKYRNALSKQNLDPNDPMYARLISSMVEDPNVATTLILGIEGIKGASDAVGSFAGGIGKFIKGMQPTKMQNMYFPEKNFQIYN